MAKIIIQKGNDTFYIDLKDFVYAHTKDNYTSIICINDVIKDVRITISDLMTLIDEQETFKEHRIYRFSKNCIVNTTYKKSFEMDPRQNPTCIKKDVCTDEPLKEHFPWMTLQYGKAEVTLVGTKLGAKEYLKLEAELLREDPTKTLVKSVGHSTLTTDIFSVMLTYPTLNGHGYADLGLPSGTCWAIEDFRENTSQPHGQKTYTSVENTCKEQREICDFLGMNLSADAKLQQEFNEYNNGHDLVNNYWRSKWRIPTAKDFQELIDNCKWTWCLTQDGFYGTLIVGPNGNYIFMDADNGSIGCLHEYWIGPLSDDAYENKFAKVEVDSATGVVKMTLHSRGYRPEYCCYLRPVFTNKE